MKTDIHFIQKPQSEYVSFHIIESVDKRSFLYTSNGIFFIKGLMKVINKIRKV